MRRIAAGMLLLAVAQAQAAPNVLTVPSTYDRQCQGGVSSAITATLGSSFINNPLFVDYDTDIVNGTPSIADLTNASATTIFSVASGLQVGPPTHAPYLIATSCVIGGVVDDLYGNYQAVLAASAVITGIATSPPANTTTPAQLPAVGMLVTATNSTDGNKGVGGYGTEFFLSPSYLGLNTSSDSFNSGNLAGIAAAVAYAHSSFNAFDIHATLRQTASNWSTGWNLTNAYGNVSYSAAAGTISTVYLQPPDLQVQNFGYYAIATLYAFRTTRRDHEVVYSCTAGFNWAAYITGGANELTLAQVQAGCGTLLYTSNGTDVAPSFTYAPAASGTATFVAFTTDNSGHYSRVESYQVVTETFNVSVQCYQ